MATAYHRDQAGAPALVYGAANSLTQFNALKTILKACLVNGYGSYPAAGWELTNEGANFLVLRTGSHSGYVCLTWATGGMVRVYLAETYTGMSGDVMVGAGLKTGTAAGNATPQALDMYLTAYRSETSTWAVVADSKTFVLTCADYLTGGAAPALTFTDPSSYALHTLYAGEDSAGNLISCGGNNTTSTGGGAIYSYFGASGFTALKNPATGLLVDTGSLAVVTPGLTSQGTSNIQTVTIPLAEVELGKALWCGGGVYAGRLRGVALVAQLANNVHPAYAAQSLGVSGLLTTRTASTPINLGDGHTYFARQAYYAIPFFLLTDKPEFW